ncbi:MAG: hypothetical protein ACK5JD_02180 [Mangrovibacterium sp.]
MFTSKTKDEKLAQRKFFFWYKREYQREIREELTRLKRPDLLKKILD